MTERQELTDRSLWDPGAEPAPEVVEIERILTPLRYDADSRALPVVMRRTPWRRVALSIAAALLLVVAGSAVWRWTWPDGRPWHVVSGPMEELSVGRAVRLDAGHTLVARVGHIGWMRAGEGSQIRR